VFDLDTSRPHTPCIVFGGKLTTYRKLAEHAMSELRAPLRFDAREWTRGSTLPGGDIAKGDFETFSKQQAARYAFAPQGLDSAGCSRAYGTRIERVMGNAQGLNGLGEEVAPQLYEADCSTCVTMSGRGPATMRYGGLEVGICDSTGHARARAAWFAK